MRRVRIFNIKRIIILILCISMVVCTVILVLSMVPIRRVQRGYMLTIPAESFFFIGTKESETVEELNRDGLILVLEDKFVEVGAVFINRIVARDFIENLGEYERETARIIEKQSREFEVKLEASREVNDRFRALLVQILANIIPPTIQTAQDLENGRIVQSHAVLKLQDIRLRLLSISLELDTVRGEIGEFASVLFSYTTKALERLDRVIDLRFNNSLLEEIRHFSVNLAYSYIEVFNIGT